jgi:hypothetical protein
MNDTKTLADYFETRTRDDGTRFVTLTDDRPDWLQDAVMEAHDDELPNDWRFETCAAIAEWLDGLLDLDDADDMVSEFADAQVDVYTSDRLRWVAGHLGRVDYCDEAASEYGSGARDGIVDRIGQGQYLCIERMASLMLNAYRVIDHLPAECPDMVEVDA